MDKGKTGNWENDYGIEIAMQLVDIVCNIDLCNDGEGGEFESGFSFP